MAKPPKIRLLILVPNLHCGGSEKFVWLLSKYIDTEKFSVCIAVLDNSAPFFKIENVNIAVVDLGCKRVVFSFFKIRHLINEFQPSLVFSASNHLNLYLSVLRSFLPAGIGFLARESSIVSINTRHTKWPAFYNWLIRKFYNRLDIIFCQSKFMQADLIDHYNLPASKTVMINNPVEVSIPEKALIGTETNELIKFVTVARLSPEKGIDRLIEALALLDFPFNFFIIGDGSQCDDLELLVNKYGLTNQIFFNGEQPFPFEGMQNADLFLMGSYYEGFPNALAEANMLGIPAVAFDAPGGIGEIIKHGFNGLLVKENTAEAFAGAVKQALGISFNRGEIADRAKQMYLPHKIIKQYEDYFSSQAGQG